MAGKLIIIEGLDRTGKSTLAKLLADPDEPLHFSKPERHPLDEYLEPIARWLPDETLIIDRYHLGETVWPTIFNRPTVYDVPMHAYVELALKARGALLVLTTRDMDDLKAHLVRDGEPLSPDLAGDAAVLFIEAADSSLLYTRSYRHLSRASWRRQAAMDIKIDAVRLNKLAAPIFDVTTEFVGEGSSPWVLLVGDEPRTAKQKQYGTPAIHPLPFVPFRATSGHYLMSELITDSDLLDSVGIMNAVNSRGAAEDLAAAYETIAPDAVVALGRTASAELRRQGVPHGTIQHPQYARRFLRATHQVGSGVYAESIMMTAESAESRTTTHA